MIRNHCGWIYSREAKNRMWCKTRLQFKKTRRDENENEEVQETK